jgi:hypothetical protein
MGVLRILPQSRTRLGWVAVIAVLIDLVVYVEPKNGPGQLRRGGDERIQHGRQIDVGAHALGVHRDDGLSRCRPGSLDAGSLHHMRVRQNVDLSTPLG